MFSTKAIVLWDSTQQMTSAFLENKVSRAAKLREVMLPRKNLHSDLDSTILVCIGLSTMFVCIGLSTMFCSILLLLLLLLYWVPSQMSGVLTTTRHVKLSLHSSFAEGNTLCRWVVCKSPPIHNKSPSVKGTQEIWDSPSFLNRKFLGAPIERDNIGTTS